VILEKPVTSKLLNFFIRFLHLISYLVANFYGISYLNIEIPFLGQTISPRGGEGGEKGGFAIFPPHTIINQQYYLPIQNIYHIAVW